MTTPDFGECAVGVIIDEQEPFPPPRVTQRPSVYLGKRVNPRGPRANRNHFLGPNYRYLWFEKNGEVSMLLIHLGSLRIVQCHPEEGPLKAVIQKKAIDAETRRLYEGNTNQSAAPGHGPADLIRKMVGVQPPRGSGTRRRKTIRMKKSEYLREHHHLFKVLRNPTRRALNAELRRQQKELKETGLKG